MPLTRNRIREIRSLAEKSGRDEQGLFVAEGLRLVGDAAASAFEIPEAFSTAEFSATAEGAHLMGILRARGTLVSEVTYRELAQCADTVTPQGVIALVRTKSESASGLLKRLSAPSLIVALDGIADPGNLGSIIRTCDWFGAGGIFLGKGSVDPYNPKAVRS
ncbi:MAG TPA: RNA methyltransferase, partial [Bacteroidota bacterium]|nr:RNA methyltransferase [Bacteroidota bacterium]